MASSFDEGSPEPNSASASPGTPGTPGSNESDVPEEFHMFRDIICPELFRENVPRNTSLLQGAEWIAEIMTTPHEGRFFDNIRMTKPCFYALVDALTSRGLLPHGQTSRVSSIEEVALFMQTVGMHKRQRDNMERFQHSLETIHRRFHRVLSALCTMAPELITPPNFTEIHTRIANNPDFFPFFKDCVGAMDGSLCGRCRVLDHAVSHDPTFPFPPIGKYYLVDAGFTNYQCFLAPYRGTRYHLPEWRGQGRRYGTPQDMFNHAHSRLRNVIERCFGVLKKRFPILQWGMPSYLLNHQVDIVIACCTLHNFIHMAYRRYLESAGFPQDLHWSLNVEQRFMWMIVDDNTRAPMRDDALAEAQMGHWARALRRHFGYPYTRDQVREKFYELKRRFNQFHAITQLPGIFYDIETFVMVFPSELRLSASRDQGDAQDNESSNSLRGPVRGGVDAPIVISDSAAPSVQTHTHIASWDAVEHVARGDGGPRFARSTSLAARRSLDMGSEVGHWIMDRLHPSFWGAV
ncbi:UNVERIFIED_CONTAM: hypothetical protein Sradi_6242400 [Sesamum radiatum]|uniref:DDE Tnp4 domain-containing protein n=1 Tax=Sesamum radiatum TaxID=300843 RepID=A0AAW2KD08_SESRA